MSSNIFGVSGLMTSVGLERLHIRFHSGSLLSLSRTIKKQEIVVLCEIKGIV